MTDSDVAAFGHLVLPLAPGTDLGRMRARTANLLLAVLDGEVEVTQERRPPDVLGAGGVLALPAGRAWSARAQGPARLLVVAVPAGPERVIGALSSEPAMPPHRRLTLALEEGVELLL